MKKIVTILFTILLVINSYFAVYVNAQDKYTNKNQQETNISNDNQGDLSTEIDSIDYAYYQTLIDNIPSIENITQDNLLDVYNEYVLPLEEQLKSLTEDEKSNLNLTKLDDINNAINNLLQEEQTQEEIARSSELTVLETGSCGDNATYTVYSDYSMVISGSGTVKFSSKPSNYSQITSLTIGDGITSIGENSFLDYSTLSTVTIPNTVTSIGSDAFFNCSLLTRVNTPSIEAWLNIDFSNQMANPLGYAHNLYINDVLLKNLVIPESIS